MTLIFQFKRCEWYIIFKVSKIYFKWHIILLKTRARIRNSGKYVNIECDMLFIFLFAFLLYKPTTYKKILWSLHSRQTLILQCSSHSQLQTLNVMFSFYLVHGLETPWPSSFTIFPLSIIFVHLYFSIGYYSPLIHSTETNTIRSSLAKKINIRHFILISSLMAKDLTPSRSFHLDFKPFNT